MINNEPLFIYEDEKNSFDELIRELEVISKIYAQNSTSVPDLREESIYNSDEDENDLKAQNPNL